MIGNVSTRIFTFFSKILGKRCKKYSNQNNNIGKSSYFFYPSPAQNLRLAPFKKEFNSSKRSSTFLNTFTSQKPAGTSPQPLSATENVFHFSSKTKTKRKKKKNEYNNFVQINHFWGK